MSDTRPEPTLTPAEARALQTFLIQAFERYPGLAVSVGLTKTGVAIRSQDPRVDASNVGAVERYDAGWTTGHGPDCAR